MNIASSVVTQQNSGLGSMNTGEVLDLFKVSAEGEAQKKKESKGPISASKILEGWVLLSLGRPKLMIRLDDLPPEDEYSDLSLSNFMSKV
jgi:TATA-binding protein-associated factor